MKNTLVLLFVINLLGFLQACEPKKIKSEPAEIQEAVVEQKVTPTKEEKRAEREQNRLSRIEKRKVILQERLKNGIYFTDASNKVVYLKAEIEPSFPGGEEALMAYLNKTIQYPKEAFENGDEGTIFVNFVVSQDGRVRDVMVVNEPTETNDTHLMDEAIRVVKSMPKWNPGKQQGKAVEVAFEVPITFRLD
jgi:TonB family protein